MISTGNHTAVFIMSRSLSVYLSVYLVTSIRPLIGGPMWECYIVDEVIEVDELDEEKIFPAAGKQDK